MNAKTLATVALILSALALPAWAKGQPSDIQVSQARVDGTYVTAMIKNVSNQEVDSFTTYFDVYSKDGKLLEIVEAKFTGRLRIGASTVVKGPIYKAGANRVGLKEVKFFW